MKLKAKVWQNKGNGQKLVTIPKNCDIVSGDVVWIVAENDANIAEQTKI